MARLRCEHNYAVSFYVAEFFNCFSNLAIVAAGLLGLRNALRHGYPRRVLVLYTAITVIGLGSAAFHGTLLRMFHSNSADVRHYFKGERLKCLQCFN